MLAWANIQAIIIICSYFASRVKAIVADSRGVEALVPVNPSVQPPLRSIVVCYKKNIHEINFLTIIIIETANFTLKTILISNVQWTSEMYVTIEVGSGWKQQTLKFTVRRFATEFLEPNVDQKRAPHLCTL